MSVYLRGGSVAMRGGGGVCISPVAGGGGATSPDLSALPDGVYDVGDWNGALTGLATINNAFTDKTGAVLRKVTSSTSPATDNHYAFTYASGGAKISQPRGTGSDEYWFVYESFNAAASSGNGARLAKYQLGVGKLSDVSFAPTGLNAGRLSYTFSMRAGEEDIVYFVTDAGTIHRYNVSTGAFSRTGFTGDSSLFNGTNAGTSGMGSTAGWLQMSWDGTRLAWVANTYADPAELHYLNLDTGVHTTYTGSQVANVNDIRINKGSSNVCSCANDDGTKSFWFVDSNRVTLGTSSIPGTQGHSDCLDNIYITVNADGSHVSWDKNTFGSAPGSDGGSWGGSSSAMAAGSSPSNVIIDGDYHCNSVWDQTGNASQYFCIDNDLTSPYKNTAVSWTVHSGSIYKTSVSWGTYASNAIGPSGVLLWNGSTSAGTFTGHIPKAASLAGMTSSSWWWESNTLYVWYPDSSSPSGKIRIVNGSLLGEAVGYIKVSDGSTKKLCYDYRNEGTYNYFKSAFANWSPDGKIVGFSSNLGVQDARCDIIICEVPVA